MPYFVYGLTALSLRVTLEAPNPKFVLLGFTVTDAVQQVVPCLMCLLENFHVIVILHMLDPGQKGISRVKTIKSVFIMIW